MAGVERTVDLLLAEDMVVPEVEPIGEFPQHSVASELDVGLAQAFQEPIFHEVDGYSLASFAKPGSNGGVAFDMRNNILLASLDDEIGIVNEVAEKTLFETGTTRQDAWPIVAPYNDMKGPPLILRGRPSIQFSGSNYAFIPSAAEVYSKISVSFWVKFPVASSVFRCVLGKYRSGGSVNALILGSFNSGGAKWYCGVTGAGFSQHFSTTAVTADRTHVVWTLEEVGADVHIRLFINGVEDTLSLSTASNTSLGLDEASPWVLGADADAGFSIGDRLSADTLVQDLRVWRNRALQDYEVTDLYQEALDGTPVKRSAFQTGLRMVLSGESYERFPQDRSGQGNHGTFLHDALGSNFSPPLPRREGLRKGSRSLEFQGAQRVEFTDFGMNDDASMVVAFKASALPNPLNGVFGKHSSSDAAVITGHNLVQLWVSSSGGLTFQLHGGPGEVNSSPGLVTPGEWYVFAATLESIAGTDTRIRMYLDGVKVVDDVVFGRTVNNGPQTFTGAGRRPWVIGVDYEVAGNPTDPWDGYLQDFMIFNETLSDGDVIALNRVLRGEEMTQVYDEAPMVSAISAKDMLAEDNPGARAAVESVDGILVPSTALTDSITPDKSPEPDLVGSEFVPLSTEDGC